MVFYLIRIMQSSSLNAYQEIQQWLERLPGAPAAAEGVDMLTVLRTLDALVLQHGKSLDAHLTHYLKNRSYEKARLWLLENSKENA